MLVGTKSDLRGSTLLRSQGHSLVTTEQIKEVRSKIGAVVNIECSALTQEGLQAVFDDAIRVGLGIYDKKKKKKGCILI